MGFQNEGLHGFVHKTPKTRKHIVNASGSEGRWSRNHVHVFTFVFQSQSRIQSFFLLSTHVAVGPTFSKYWTQQHLSRLHPSWKYLGDSVFWKHQYPRMDPPFTPSHCWMLCLVQYEVRALTFLSSTVQWTSWEMCGYFEAGSAQNWKRWTVSRGITVGSVNLRAYTQSTESG